MLGMHTSFISRSLVMKKFLRPLWVVLGLGCAGDVLIEVRAIAEQNPPGRVVFTKAKAQHNDAHTHNLSSFVYASDLFRMRHLQSPASSRIAQNFLGASWSRSHIGAPCGESRMFPPSQTPYVPAQASRVWACDHRRHGPPTQRSLAWSGFSEDSSPIAKSSNAAPSHVRRRTPVKSEESGSPGKGPASNLSYMSPSPSTRSNRQSLGFFNKYMLTNCNFQTDCND